MLTMDQINDIRNRFYLKGQNLSQIASTLKVDWKTVQKYVDMEDFNQTPKKLKKHRITPKLDPFKATIDTWLENDKKAPRKQRHTAKRVFERLRESFPDSFDCSYRTVCTYFSYRHKQIFSEANEGFLPLEHRPGSMQVDFGAADFYENGKQHSGKYVEASFPHSNQGYMQLFHGENMECLLEGLTNIFKHMGSVPREIWFDNTKTIVTKILKDGQRDTTETFNRFKEHYRFKAVFTNPGKGHEKGNVECKVGYQRRNFLVPVPEFSSLSEFNKELLELCDKDSKREHYRRNETIDTLFQEDLKNCHPLPTIPFDTTRYQKIKTNKWGKFYLNGNLHEYSVSPKYANTFVWIQLSATNVIVLDENFSDIVCHPRFYGDKKQQSMNWIPYLKQLSRKPLALKYSGVYELMPCNMKQFIETCSGSDLSQMLKAISELTERTGFESALHTINQALLFGANDIESLKNLYRRLYADVPELPPMELRDHVPALSPMNTNLQAYDALLEKGGLNHV